MKIKLRSYQVLGLTKNFNQYDWEKTRCNNLSGCWGPVLGVGAAAVAGGGTAAFIGQMMSGCPRSRPCRVRLTISSVNLFLIF